MNAPAASVQHPAALAPLALARESRTWMMQGFAGPADHSRLHAHMCMAYGSSEKLTRRTCKLTCTIDQPAV
eukprot:351773-Chlamydomonas_euryale.AAC.21